MNHTRRSILVTSFNLSAAVTLAGQSDDWFQGHDLRNRWEGLFGENQGSPAWELRSFVATVEPYSMEVNANLKIRYYVPTSTEAFIKAQVVRRNPSYLMQPKPRVLKNNAGWREFDGWPTKDVLLPKRIAAKDLGVLIRLGADSDTVNTFSPAIVYSSAAPVPVTSYRFDFFTQSALRNFDFDVLGTGYRRTYRNQPGTGDRGNLVIQFDAAKIPPGPTRVLLSPRYEKSNETLNLEWKFYHQPLL